MARKFQRATIKPLLRAIEKHQDYLCKPENLPQLAKLGYMFELLWYSGRVSYGYRGRIADEDSCENNPKYELGDEIKYNSDKNEDLIYDAWGMHVSNDINPIDFEGFRKLIYEGKPLTDFELQQRKPNKTFDEWVAVMTDDKYKYKSLFPDRRSVANYLLLVFGTGFGYNKTTGLIFKEASGADQDKDLYGDWENAKFSPAIQKVVDKIMAVPEVKLAVDCQSAVALEWKAMRDAEERERNGKFYKILLPEINKALKLKGKPEVTLDSPEFAVIVKRYMDLKMEEMGNKKRKRVSVSNFKYYPLSEGYSIITMLDENTHPSYINAALEICEDIIGNPEESSEKDFNGNTNLEFAQKFLEKWKTKDEHKEIFNK